VNAPDAVSVRGLLAEEEGARADFYALLSRLLMSAPDAALLRALATAQPLPAEAREDLRDAWRGLTLASNAMDADAAAEEYESLFVGMGKAAVPIYAGAYGNPGVTHRRVSILEDLAALRLGRPDTVTEPEDHVAGLLEVMRILVAGGAGRGPAELQAQRRFFEAHLAHALPRCFAALAVAGQANYYRHVAALGQAFVSLETESFSLE
jgi:TorA maturation chaperone TorD